MFDPASYADLAFQITRDTSLDAEARTRASVSRSYYALFLAVRTAIRATDGRPTHGRGDDIEHGRLALVLHSADDDGLSAVAKMLESLVVVRKQADYVLDPEQRWASFCQKPEKARLLAKQTRALLQRLPSLNWSLTAGKL